jgi:hypothetical protein
MAYFSERELGKKARDKHEITHSVWGGLVSLIESHITTGAFGNSFPKHCPDGAGITGTDEHQIHLAAQAEIPNISWPLKLTHEDPNDFLPTVKNYTPDTYDILDLIEFCYEHVAEPIQDGYHKFFNHHHLKFDVGVGKQKFKERVNRIFSRNGMAYELQNNGQIIRLAPLVLHEDLIIAKFNTRDSTLNQMLEECRAKFLDPDITIRREALERLWDSWERIKSLENPANKRDSTKILLDKASSEPNFRQLLEEEARKLTDIGNNFHIRHSEVGKTPISNDNHVDYLFHKLFSIINLILKSI